MDLEYLRECYTRMDFVDTLQTNQYYTRFPVTYNLHSTTHDVTVDWEDGFGGENSFV